MEAANAVAHVKKTKDIQDESGATAIEYGLIAALIAVAIIAALQTLSGDLQSTFGDVSGALQSSSSSGGGGGGGTTP
ncbi:MAG: Flp family type IVb pilin [Henriciella sp.]|nr:Flp family type IVb pilin [Henriciella sp.]